MKSSDFIIEELYRNGTTKIFGYIGGMIAHLVDSIYKNPNIEMINTITEQGAGFAAEGYARANGTFSVAIATSGPGATNLITPIANCYFDSTPVLFITGQVNTYEYRKYPNIRQNGFQETNIVDMVKPVTKYAKMITNVEDIKYEIQKALYTMQSGRKGPVLLDIPMDIQRLEVDEKTLKGFICPPKSEYQTNVEDVEKAIKTANKPLVLVGNGVSLANAKEELKIFLQKSKLPVVESLHGISSVEKYENNAGLIGTYGNRYGNLTLVDCDTLLVLGARLDIRQTGSDLSVFENKNIIQVDIDENELACDKLKKTVIKSDIKVFLKELNKFDFELNIDEWNKQIYEWKCCYDDNSKHFSVANKFLTKIFENSKENDIFTADVGQNQMWAAQSAKLKDGQKFFSSGGHGCMGFALPAGIGASFKNRCIVISGDGGMQMNLQELEIIKRRKLPVKIIVMNNSNLGMVRTFQELYFEGRTASTVWDYSAPDFAQIANAYGIKAKTININDDFDLSEIFSNNEPFLLNVKMDLKTEVEPRLQFGNPINKQHPLLEEKK